MLHDTLGQRLRQARLEAGFSGAQLARLIGRSQPYISDLERGQRTPSLTTLQAIAAALGKPPSFFLDASMSEAAATQEPSPPSNSWGCFLIAAGHVEDLEAARRLSQIMAVGGVQSFLFRSRRDLDREQLSAVIHDFLERTLDQASRWPKSRLRYEDFEDVPRRRRLSRTDVD